MILLLYNIFELEETVANGVQWLIKIYHQYQYFWKYALFGFMAALVNVLVFWVLHSVLAEHYLFSNTIAWVLATLFSFFTNKIIDQVLVGLFNYGTSRLIFMESNQKMRMRQQIMKRLSDRNN